MTTPVSRAAANSHSAGSARFSSARHRHTSGEAAGDAGTNCRVGLPLTVWGPSSMPTSSSPC
ncbi:hypothetical protein HEP87_62200 [Streptomyces sp. S1D4-11]